MKIVHWSLSNGSGLNRVAHNLCEGEKELGYNSIFIATDKTKDGELDKTGWEDGMDADIYVVHSCLPDDARKNKNAKIVFIPHGTPEVCFDTSIDKNTVGAWGLTFDWLRRADAVVTFWHRHLYIWKSFIHKNALIEYIPMGINLNYWKPVKSRGKYAGTPSVLFCENSHRIKWCYDIAIAWPEVVDTVHEARLHIFYLPTNQIPTFFPMFYANGIVANSFISSFKLENDDLRNAFVSADYYANLVAYGDHNSVGLEAKACGCKVISYSGNPYADYWLSSQDQRVIATELIEILKGNIKPRDSKPVVDISETAKSMISIYERILSTNAHSVSNSNPIKIKADILKAEIEKEFPSNGEKDTKMVGVQA